MVQKAQLSAELDQTRTSLVNAKGDLEVSQRRFDEVEQKGRETSKRLQMVQEELQGLRAEDGDSPVRSTLQDAKAVLEQKKAKLNQQTLQAEKLQKELQDNREQLEKQSVRMADVHAEATECEMKSKCLDEQKLQLQRELDAKPGAKTGCATGTKEGDDSFEDPTSVSQWPVVPMSGKAWSCNAGRCSSADMPRHLSGHSYGACPYMQSTYEAPHARMLRVGGMPQTV
ncbi:unnamed protein product [Symbiodinium natans]|uniref:Uncharacterized protein n=1 Tax=Symbiodinium natans TaxID=878477 RepID=A0A812IM25_9DINO|nr:unnamed protein product [Symbiodinium natans]